MPYLNREQILALIENKHIYSDKSLINIYNIQLINNDEYT